MSNKDDFYNEGLLAYNDGLYLEECPYDEGTDGEYGWKSGWRHGDSSDQQVSE